MKIFFLLCLLIFVNPSSATCPSGAISIPPTIGSKWSCLSISFSKKSFLMAELQCQESGGHLISIPNGFVDLFIRRKFLLINQ